MKDLNDYEVVEGSCAACPFFPECRNEGYEDFCFVLIGANVFRKKAKCIHETKDEFLLDTNTYMDDMEHFEVKVN